MESQSFETDSTLQIFTDYRMIYRLQNDLQNRDKRSCLNPSVRDHVASPALCPCLQIYRMITEQITEYIYRMITEYIYRMITEQIYRMITEQIYRMITE